MSVKVQTVQRVVSERVRMLACDAWLCSLFRNESAILSSQLIVEEVAATRWRCRMCRRVAW